MADDKRYRECMAEIIGVLRKYDMAGAITVVSKERAMFRYFFPTWSCVQLTDEQLRIRSKREDYPSAEAMQRTNELTAHIIMQMRDQAARTAELMDLIRDRLQEAWGIEHTPGFDFDPEREQ